MNILIVDHHPLMRTGLELVLSRVHAGLQVTAVSSLAQATDERRHGPPPDLVISEWNLPDSRGPSTLARLRAAHPGVPLVVWSSADDPGRVQSAVDHGAMSFIHKTPDLDELIAALQRVLDGGVHLPRLALAIDPLPPDAARLSRVHADLQPVHRELLLSLIKGSPSVCDDRGAAAGGEAHPVRSLLDALGLGSRSALVFALARTGLLLAGAAWLGDATPQMRRDQACCVTASGASNWSGTHSLAANASSYR